MPKVRITFGMTKNRLGFILMVTLFCPRAYCVETNLKTSKVGCDAYTVKLKVSELVQKYTSPNIDISLVKPGELYLVPRAGGTFQSNGKILSVKDGMAEVEVTEVLNGRMESFITSVPLKELKPATDIGLLEKFEFMKNEEMKKIEDRLRTNLATAKNDQDIKDAYSNAGFEKRNLNSEVFTQLESSGPGARRAQELLAPQRKQFAQTLPLLITDEKKFDVVGSLATSRGGGKYQKGARTLLRNNDDGVSILIDHKSGHIEVAVKDKGGDTAKDLFFELDRRGRVLSPEEISVRHNGKCISCHNNGVLTFANHEKPSARIQLSPLNRGFSGVTDVVPLFNNRQEIQKYVQRILAGQQ